jgi:hypothetical protein
VEYDDAESVRRPRLDEPSLRARADSEAAARSQKAPLPPVGLALTRETSQAVADLVYGVYDSVAQDGLLVRTDPSALTVRLAEAEGVEYHAGMLDADYATDPGRTRCELDDCYVLVAADDADAAFADEGVILDLVLPRVGARPVLFVVSELGDQTRALLRLTRLAGTRAFCVAGAPPGKGGLEDLLGFLGDSSKEGLTLSSLLGTEEFQSGASDLEPVLVRVAKAIISDRTTLLARAGRSRPESEEPPARPPAPDAAPSFRVRPRLGLLDLPAAPSERRLWQRLVDDVQFSAGGASTFADDAALDGALRLQLTPGEKCPIVTLDVVDAADRPHHGVMESVVDRSATRPPPGAGAAGRGELRDAMTAEDPYLPRETSRRSSRSVGGPERAAETSASGLGDAAQLRLEARYVPGVKTDDYMTAVERAMGGGFVVRTRFVELRQTYERGDSLRDFLSRNAARLCVRPAFEVETLPRPDEPASPASSDLSVYALYPGGEIAELVAVAQPATGAEPAGGDALPSGNAGAGVRFVVAEPGLLFGPDGGAEYLLGGPQGDSRTFTLGVVVFGASKRDEAR